MKTGEVRLPALMVSDIKSESAAELERKNWGRRLPEHLQSKPLFAYKNLSEPSVEPQSRLTFILHRAALDFDNKFEPVFTLGLRRRWLCSEIFIQLSQTTGITPLKSSGIPL